MKNILLVDDNNDILELMMILLKDKGYNVTAMSTANNVLSNKTLVNKDLIIMDIYLSGHDGSEICRALKSSDIFRKIPVILYTAAVTSEESVYDSGADSFIRKPFEIKDLYNVVEQYIKK